MVNRDVDSVDPALPPPVPELIALAERWRVAGVELKKRSPDLYQKVFMMLVAYELVDDDDEPPLIT